MLDLIREIGQAMRNNKLRTFLTGFAVTWGIFMLIILLGMARGVTNSFAERTSGDRSKRLNVYSGVTSKPYKGFKEGRWITPDVDDIERLKADNPDLVESVASYKYLGSTDIASVTDHISKSPEGVYPAEQEMYRIPMLYGRFINDADLRSLRKVMVIGSDDAKTLFGDAEKAVGQRVNAFGLSWLVTGVYDHEWLSDVYIPFTTAMAIGGTDGKVSNLQVKLKGMKTMEDADRATSEVRRSLARAHDYDESDESALYMHNRFSSYLRESQSFSILNMSIWIIGIFTLLSGIVGVSNIMFVSVRERTHEISIRRAIGAKPRSVLLQVVLESVAITALFGYIGVFLGMTVMQLVDMAFGSSDFMRNPTIDISIAIEVTIVLVMAGALAGLFPALKATKVKPVEALRDE
ncbi:ABC transporter permease [Paramuribaculum intestinale]|uniref:ABC transporter permease n=1 Tax=Paramuribaculum intestinale TaxID=2094151 RepID=UPI0025B718BC|nr:ABC transporter permease [Paramuribaculum intestinale]